MPGLYFEEFTVGQTFDHPIRRTITETDNVLLTTMTHNPAPLHLDAEYMKNTEFGKPIVNSCLTLSFMVGISINDTTHCTTVAATRPKRHLCEPLRPVRSIKRLDRITRTVFGDAARPTALSCR